MPRLSSPVENLKTQYPVVVIGTGYGGAIAASRLARAGRNVDGALGVSANFGYAAA